MNSILLFAFLTVLSTISCHNISDKGLNLIKEFEGCVLTAYKDKYGGVWTIGYGTTDADRAITGTYIYDGLTISQATADEWLRLSVNSKYGPNVDRFDDIYHWTQNEFDALCSFAYNLGSINKLVQNGNLPKSQIPSAMLQFVHAGGEVLDGLVRRRKAEAALFTNGGSYDPVPSGKTWYPPVNGYNINDPNNGYAGKLGVPVTGLTVDGGREYRVHIKGGRWLSSVTGNDINEPNNGYAGTIKGDAIDGVAIQGGVKYRVHVMGKGWLPEVTGYNINDSIHGYAGILGQTIDAVMINGRRYATSHN